MYSWGVAFTVTEKFYYTTNLQGQNDIILYEYWTATASNAKLTNPLLIYQYVWDNPLE